MLHLAALLRVRVEEVMEQAGERARATDGAMGGEKVLRPFELVEYARSVVAREDIAMARSAYFGAVCAWLVRRVIAARVNWAEGGGAGGRQRGGKIPWRIVDRRAAAAGGPGVEAGRFERALRRLELVDSIGARLVEIQVFGGLTLEETSAIMNLPASEVRLRLRVLIAGLIAAMDEEVQLARQEP